MNVRTWILWGGLLALMFAGCKKETTSPWVYCEDCSAPVWVGSYEGTGDYYSETSGEQFYDTETQVDVVEMNDSRLKFSVLAPDLYEVTFTVLKDNNDNFVNLSGSTSSLHVTLTQNGSQDRITGTAKHYHWDYSPDTVLLIDHSLSFEVFSIQE